MLSRVIFPTLTRTKRRVGQFTALVILRTCLNLPSVIVIETHDVGPCLASLIFFERSGKSGNSFNFVTLQGFVIYLVQDNLTFQQFSLTP